MDVKFLLKEGKGLTSGRVDGLYTRLAQHGIDVVTDDRMDVTHLADYRYHIDLGGGGGTTVSGLFAKLAMPGLLFHHETTMTEFLLNDELKPYIHYIPVKMDLSDLMEKLRWAESHPKESETIAKAATAFAIWLKEKSTADELLLKYVKEPMKDLMWNYVHTAGTNKLLDDYVTAGIPRKRVRVIPL